jgi:hypothetical protein
MSKPLWFHRAVVDANVVDQALPEGAGCHVVTAADQELAGRSRQTRLSVLGYQHFIDIEGSFDAVPREGDPMSVAVRDGRFRGERGRGRCVSTGRLG